MTALAQGTAGLAAILGLALLGVRQVSAATTLLAAQSLAAAVADLALQQPTLAALTLLADGIGAVCLLRWWFPASEPAAQPPANDWLAVLAGAALVALCQPLGALAQPLAVLLLALLLAAARQHPWRRFAAVIALQNGLAVTAATVDAPTSAALPGLLLALPMALAVATNRRRLVPPAILGSVHVAICALLLIASVVAPVVAPMDRLGLIAAPLVAGWSLAAAWSVRQRRQAVASRIGAVVKTVAVLTAVTVPLPAVMVLALTFAAAAVPAARHRPEALVLACCGGGLLLFGLLAQPLPPSTIAVGSLVLGLAALVAAAPDLGPVAGVAILRLGASGAWPLAASPMLAAVATAGALAAAAALLIAAPHRRLDHRRLDHLRLVQSALLGLALSLADPRARLAALLLIGLLILTEAALALSRTAPTDSPAAAAARAGLSGLPPFGVFPGLVLLAVSAAATAPWTLLPIGIGIATSAWAGLPPRLPTYGRPTLPSPAWIPLCLGLAVGYAAPAEVLHWLQAASVRVSP